MLLSSFAPVAESETNELYRQLQVWYDKKKPAAGEFLIDLTWGAVSNCELWASVGNCEQIWAVRNCELWVWASMSNIEKHSETVEPAPGNFLIW